MDVSKMNTKFIETFHTVKFHEIISEDFFLHIETFKLLPSIFFKIKKNLLLVFKISNII